MRFELSALPWRANHFFPSIFSSRQGGWGPNTDSVFKTLDRHILVEWLVVLGLVTGATFGLLMLQDMFGGVRNLLRYGASVGQIGFYYLILAPSFLSMVLPVSILISLLYSLGRLHRNNEFIALRSAGIGLLRMTRWIWIMGFLLSGLLFFLQGGVIPWSVEQSRRLWDNLVFAHQAKATEVEQVGLVYGLAFDNQRENRLWFVNRFSEYSYRAYGITLSQMDEQRREVRRVMATEGFYDDVDRAWVFLNGREMSFDPETGDMVGSKAFDQQILSGIEDDPRLMLLLGKDADDLSFFEVRKILETLTPEENPKLLSHAVYYHQMLAETMRCLIMVGLAIPFAVTGVRANPAVGVSKSLALFLAYYILTVLSTTLAERGFVEPLLAAWFPNLIMMVIALWLMRKLY
ncbi:MAG: YjgP/YjgQ family permease [Verrucomicrobia bacterium]|nr:MAG: YjgP/YjgQ family permease [Verrucomicrobiota bacterium]